MLCVFGLDLFWLVISLEVVGGTFEYLLLGVVLLRILGFCIAGIGLMLLFIVIVGVCCVCWVIGTWQRLHFCFDVELSVSFVVLALYFSELFASICFVIVYFGFALDAT